MNKIRILFVDNDEGYVKSIKDAYESLGNNIRITHSDPGDSLLELKTRNYDMMIIDIGEASFGERPFGLVDRVRDLRPNMPVVSRGGMGLAVNEAGKYFDEHIYERHCYVGDEIIKILEEYGFEVEGERQIYNDS